jgi:hypothetical protein
MARFRFIGDPRDNFSGPDVMEYELYTFPRDVWVTIKDPRLIAKLSGHSHYEADFGKAVEPAPIALPPEPAFEEEPNDSEELYLAKGPRGLWYVKRGGKRVSSGFHTEDEALSELHTLSGEI